MHEAIILAGGKGTRLRSVIDNTPKPMAKVNGVPFLEILLNQLIDNKMDRVILSVGYMADAIINYFGLKYKNLEICYSIEHQPLGTGGAIKQSLGLLKSRCALVLNGDTYVDMDYKKLFEQYSQNKRPILGVTFISDVSRYGSVEVSQGQLVGFKEKGSEGQGLISTGVYLLDKDILNDFEVNRIFSFENDFLQKFYERITFDINESKGKFIDIGIPEDYFYAQNYLKNES